MQKLFFVVTLMLASAAAHMFSKASAFAVDRADRRALMISERAHRQPMAAKLQAREVDLIRLMPQERGADDRQLLVLPRGHRRLYGFSGPQREVTFENVPYARGT